MEDIVGDLFSHLASSTNQYQNSAKRGKTGTRSQNNVIIPDLDIYDSPTHILLHVALPGVEKEAVNVEFDAKSNRVLISGETAAPKLGDDVKPIRQERPIGKFERAVGLNTQQVVPEGIEASFNAGILSLKVPKDTKSEEKRKISIK
jgi:HSP20 family protein